LPNSRDAVEKVRAVAEAARGLRALRREIMQANGWSLRELYRTLAPPPAPTACATPTPPSTPPSAAPTA
jgi:hypothetical protein